MKRKTFGGMYYERLKLGYSNVNAFISALTQRLDVECRSFDEIEAKIARWEALEEACVQGGPQMVEVMRALRADVPTPRNPVSFKPHTIAPRAQALQPIINAELVKVPAECGCGGPAGHVPNGVHCRKELHV